MPIKTNGVMVSHTRGWALIGDLAVADGDPCVNHLYAEGYL